MEQNELTAIVSLLPFEMKDSEPRHHNFHLSLEKAPIEVNFITLYGQEQLSSKQYNLLPNSTKWKHPFMGPICTFRLWKHLKKLGMNHKYAVYLYEGSLTWAAQLSLLSYFGRLKAPFVVNLFPSQDRLSKLSKSRLLSKPLQSLFLLTIQFFRAMNVLITIDNKEAPIVPLPLRKKTLEFPLFSSLSQSISQRLPIVRKHKKVLILERNCNSLNLVELLENSCTKCTFFTLSPDSRSENMQSNLHLIPNVISRESYSQMYNDLDYVIFLYDVENNSSGRILDVCQLNIPVCIPKSSTYLLKTAQQSASYHEFEIDNHDSIEVLFNHPRFVGPIERKDWGPETFSHRIWQLLQERATVEKSSSSKIFFIALTITLFYLSTRLCTAVYLAYSKFVHDKQTE